jgi:hypothetical protein
MNKSLLRPAVPSDSFGSVPRLGLSHPLPPLRSESPSWASSRLLVPLLAFRRDRHALKSELGRSRRSLAQNRSGVHARRGLAKKFCFPATFQNWQCQSLSTDST